MSASDDDPTNVEDGPTNPDDGTTNPDDGTTTAGALNTIASGAAWVFGGRIAKLTLLFGIEILMARLLGTTGYGGVVLAVMLISMGTIVGNLGVPAGIIRKLPENEDDPDKARGVLRAGFLLGICGGVGVGVLVFLAAPYIGRFVFGDLGLTPLFRVAAVGIPFVVAMQVGISVAKASRDAQTHVAVRQLLRPLSTTVLVSLFVGLGFGATGAVAGQVGAAVIAAAGAVYLGLRTLQFDLQGPAGGSHREMLTFSLPLVFAGSMSFLINNTDTFLIGAFLTPGAVGIYNAAFQLQQLGMVFFFPATFLLPPLITRFQTEGKLPDARRTYQLVTKWMTLATLPVFVLLILFPEVTILASFGPAYTGAANALRVLAVPVFATVLLGANGTTLIALDHSRIQMYVNGGAAAINAGLNVVLIPQFGIVGAAAASAVAYLCRDAVYTVALYRWHRFQPFSMAMAKPLAVVGLLTPPGYLAVRQLVEPTIPVVGLVGVVALGIYGVILLNLDVIEPEDFELLADVEQSAGVDLDPVRKLAHSVQLPQSS